MTLTFHPDGYGSIVGDIYQHMGAEYALLGRHTQIIEERSKTLDERLGYFGERCIGK